MSKVVILREDDRDLVELVSELLHDAGYTVLPVQTVDELLREAAVRAPCIAIVDGTSPSGYDLWWLGPELSLLGVPPVAFTAHASALDEFAADPKGFAGIIAKPFDADEFVNTVNSICWEDHQAAAS